MNIKKGQSEMVRRGKRSKKKWLRKVTSISVFMLIVVLLVGAGFYISELIKSETTSTTVTTENHFLREEVALASKSTPIIETAITISAAGDFTLGSDEEYGYHGSFVNEADVSGLSHFIKGLNNIFIEDDLTTVNLETTLTTATAKADKTFRFRGDPSYAQILTMGGIEAVNIANNHTYDYLEKGYQDTVASLETENIGYFGNGNQYITTVKNVKIGVLGYPGWDDTEELRNHVTSDIQSLREQGVQIVLVHYHWGIERQYVPTASQISLGHFTIDSGADLVVGHHPHVLQGIEEYNEKFIVYSLGNFMYGGHRNPDDKDTYVFQQTFYFENGILTDKKEIDVVPFSISSVTYRNDFQPTLLTGQEHNRVKQKIIQASNQINGSQWLVYEKENLLATQN